MPQDTDLHWVTFYTKPRAEKKVRDQLLHSGFEPYLPLQRRLHKWHDRKKWVETPLFSSYIFVHIQFKQLYSVLEQPGITRYVRFGDEIAELTEKEIDALRRLIASEKELFVQNNSQLKKGARTGVRRKERQFRRAHQLRVVCDYSRGGARTDGIYRIKDF